MEISVGLFFARYKTVISAIALLIAGKVRGRGQADVLTSACWGGCSRRWASDDSRLSATQDEVGSCCVHNPLCMPLLCFLAQVSSRAAPMQVGVMAAVGPMFGITRMQSIRAGMLLAAGGEFAFVAFGESHCLHLSQASILSHC